MRNNFFKIIFNTAQHKLGAIHSNFTFKNVCFEKKRRLVDQATLPPLPNASCLSNRNACISSHHKKINLNSSRIYNYYISSLRFSLIQAEWRGWVIFVLDLRYV